MINLTKYTSAEDDAPNQQAWTLKVVAEAENDTDLPSEIFVFQLGTNNDLDPESGDRFRCIASVHDIYDFGTQPYVGSVDDSEFIPYYRKAEVELIFRTIEEVDEVWGKIQADVQDLVRSWAISKSLIQVEQVTIEP